MIVNCAGVIALAAGALVLLVALPATAADPWAGQSFLSDYGKLRPIPGKEGKDYAYISPEAAKIAGKYNKVMLDQPEIFISSESPYKGAQPPDLAAIAGPISFDALVAATNEFGERTACRLDNGHVRAAQRIDCTDPVARKARPKVVGQ